VLALLLLHGVVQHRNSDMAMTPSIMNAFMVLVTLFYLVLPATGIWDCVACVALMCGADFQFGFDCAAAILPCAAVCAP